MPFDLLLRGGLLVDGSGSPGRLADMGIEGDRIVAIGDLAAVDDTGVATVIDATSHVVAPGFVDPHGHSDGTLFVDGALVSHLAQGYTTQLSGNCGYTFAPLTAPPARCSTRTSRALELAPAWTTFAGSSTPSMPSRWASTSRSSSATERSARPSSARMDGRRRRRSWRRWWRTSTRRSTRAPTGVSSGLIYAPGVHARPDEVAALVAAAARRDALYATHMRNESEGVLGAIDEAIATAGMAGVLAGRPPRLQVSHLKAGARACGGRPMRSSSGWTAARRDGLDVAADQYPYTAAATTLATVLPPAILALPVDDAVAAMRDPGTRAEIRRLQSAGVSGWENVRSTLAGPASSSPIRSRPELGRALGRGHRRRVGRRPGGPRARRPRRRPASIDIVIHCMASPTSRRSCACHGSRSARMPRAVGLATRSWAGVRIRERTGRPRACSGGTCASAASSASRRPSPSSAAFRGADRAARPRRPPRARLRRRRGLRPVTVADLATYDRPAVHPAGIRDVIVNGRPAIRDGRETGERPGRLLRRGA